MIINTGQRTDIPAFYSEWFFNRIKEGFVLVRNPYYPEQISRYSLTPDVVDALVFCTKNPIPMLKRLDEIAAFRQYWFVTVTPYGKEIEPLVPNKKEILKAVKALSEKVGKNNIAVRYDPVFITQTYSAAYHIRAFKRLCEVLEGFVEQYVFSFLDLYEKTKRNFPEAKAPSSDEEIFLASEFANIARAHSITLRACCENPALSRFGIDTAGCFTKEVLEQALGEKLQVEHKTPARAECACLLHADIGAYNSCPHLCKYCYANFDEATVKRNFHAHNPHSPLLIGEVEPGDTITHARQNSWISGQLTLS